MIAHLPARARTAVALHACERLGGQSRNASRGTLRHITSYSRHARRVTCHPSHSTLNKRRHHASSHPCPASGCPNSTSAEADHALQTTATSCNMCFGLVSKRGLQFHSSSIGGCCTSNLTEEQHAWGSGMKSVSLGASRSRDVW